MQILELSRGEFAVIQPGIYIVDDEELHVLAGPFASEDVAMAWIDNQDNRRDPTSLR